jgi:hypothetical protein
MGENLFIIHTQFNALAKQIDLKQATPDIELERQVSELKSLGFLSRDSYTNLAGLFAKGLIDKEETDIEELRQQCLDLGEWFIEKKPEIAEILYLIVNNDQFSVDQIRQLREMLQFMQSDIPAAFNLVIEVFLSENISEWINNTPPPLFLPENKPSPAKFGLSDWIEPIEKRIPDINYFMSCLVMTGINATFLTPGLAATALAVGAAASFLTKGGDHFLLASGKMASMADVARIATATAVTILVPSIQVVSACAALAHFGNLMYRISTQ